MLLGTSVVSFQAYKAKARPTVLISGTPKKRTQMCHLMLLPIQSQTGKYQAEWEWQKIVL